MLLTVLCVLTTVAVESAAAACAASVLSKAAATKHHLAETSSFSAFGVDHRDQMIQDYGCI